MKLLKIDNYLGLFLNKDGEYSTVDTITKDDLLRIMEAVLEGSGELDPYSEDGIKNQAHQVVYKSIYNNLLSLEERRQEYKDEAERLYLEDYKKYVDEGVQ